MGSKFTNMNFEPIFALSLSLPTQGPGRGSAARKSRTSIPVPAGNLRSFLSSQLGRPQDDVRGKRGLVICGSDMLHFQSLREQLDPEWKSPCLRATGSIICLQGISIRRRCTRNDGMGRLSVL
eukprot:jgi/Botrbrau1/2737/Bobra.0164s0017.1